MPDKEYYDKALKAFREGWLTDNFYTEYLHFSQFIQGCFISKEGYIIDTGNFQAVNYELVCRIKEKIERHPLIWKLFFMVA